MPSLAESAFSRACALDVAVRKPGNVSVASPGHRMTAAMFVASAEAAARPLCRPGARVGERIEAAVRASWVAAGCNTNLGIVLLCAPLARAVDVVSAAVEPAALRGAVDAVLDDLDVDDASAAFRAIAMANPGGLGDAEAEDVRGAPTVGLRAAMALAADRDSIARQYRDGFVDVFETGMTVWPAGLDPRAGGTAGPVVAEAVQRVYLAYLSRWPDSHIVRKRGETVAHNVMTAAQRFARQPRLDGDPAFVEWDAELKRASINPGTSADLTVATLMVAGVLAAGRRSGSATSMPGATRVTRGTERD